MKCLSCKTGETKPGTTTFAAEKDGVLVVIKHVPAQICEQCGKEYFEGKVSDGLMVQVQEAVKAGGKVNIREYIAVRLCGHGSPIAPG